MPIQDSQPRQSATSGVGSGTTTNQATGSQGHSDPYSEARQKTGEVIDQVQEKASDVADQVRDQVSEQLNNQKARAAEGLGSVAQMVRFAGDQLRQNNQAMVAQYTDKVAENLDNFSGFLRERKPVELVDEVQNFARREPALFLGGAFALGLLGARFLRSSSSNNRGNQTTALAVRPDSHPSHNNQPQQNNQPYRNGEQRQGYAPPNGRR